LRKSALELGDVGANHLSVKPSGDLSQFDVAQSV
jgi:hypothetical protein